jgi:poly-beta-1,6-N-acetyl-D-glucosamine synthase
LLRAYDGRRWRERSNSSAFSDRPRATEVERVVNAVFWISAIGLAIIWIAYPLVIAAMAALRSSGARPQSCVPAHVTVVIASADTAASIRARVADVLAAHYPPELIGMVVALDHASARATVQELDGLGPRVEVVRGDAPGGKACALNAAVRAARGDVLVFTDTAQSFDRRAISELVAALDDPRVGAVSGYLELERARRGGTLAHVYWRYERALRGFEARLHSSVGVTGAIYAMRRQLWKPLPGGLILDDVYTPMRLAIAGWRIGFTTRAVAFDERRFTPAQEYRRKVRTLTGVIQLCAWQPDVLNPFRNPIWMQFVVHKLLRLLTPYLVLLALLSVLWRGVELVIASGELSIVYAALAAMGFTILVPRLRRAVLAQLSWAWALQSSALVAGINGLKGDWDVWK